MNKKLISAAIVAASLLAPVATFAADAFTPATQIVLFEDAVNWTGPYVGVGVNANAISENTFVADLSLSAGYDVQVGPALVGAEVKLRGLDDFDFSDSYGQVTVKGGAVITDDVAAYGILGVGTNLGPSTDVDLIVGAGVEYRVTDSVSVVGEYEYLHPLVGTGADHVIGVGVRYRF